MRRRRLLLVSHRPVDYGGGGSVRWRHLIRALPKLGWEVERVSAHVNPTANEASPDPRLAALARTRATLMNGVGGLIRPAFNRAGVQPEAFAPNLLWSLTGQARVAAALARTAPDVVWATAPPHSAIPAAVRSAQQAGVPVVAELRDLWAGNPYFDAGGTMLRRLEAPWLRNADAVVTVTQGCVERLLALHPELSGRLHLLPNGFDPSLLELRDNARRAPAGRFTFLHAGSLYGDRTAAPLVRALSRPDLRERVRLELVGPADEATRAAVSARPTELEVELHAPVAWSEAVMRMRAADVCVVINSPGTGGGMALPSKLYEALALGRPVLALTPPGSDTERLLHALGHDHGTALPADEAAIAAAVIRLLADPPAAVDPQLLAGYDRDAIALKVAGLLEGVSGRSPAYRR